MHDRSDWTRGPEGAHNIKGKKYKNLIEFSRPCLTCKKPFSIFVTPKIASGEADSNSFGLKNCEEHRRSAVRGEGSVLEQLRATVTVMDQELTGLYAKLRELQDENDMLRATYELPAAVKALGPAQKSFPWE